MMIINNAINKILIKFIIFCLVILMLALLYVKFIGIYSLEELSKFVTDILGLNFDEILNPDNYN